MSDFMEKLQTPAVRWSLIFVLVAILLHFRLVLAALALPAMAYWQQSQQRAAEEEDPVGRCIEEDDAGELDDFEDDDDLDLTGNNLGPNGAGCRDSFDDDIGGGADPYDMDFWKSDATGRGAGGSVPSQGRAPMRSSPQHRSQAMRAGDDDLGLDDLGVLPDPLAGDDSLFPGTSGTRRLADDLGGMSFDFLGGGAGDDMDFFGGGSKGKSKGSGKDKGKKGKGDFSGPREDDPRQIFVAGVGDLLEEELRQFFEDIGEVQRLKVLTQPDGSSKGVCFVTFRTEEQAQDALNRHGAEIQGRRLTIRLAKAGGQSGGKDGGGKDGGGKGGFGGGGRGRPFSFPEDSQLGSEPSGNFRSGGRRFGEDDDTPSKGSCKGGRGGGKGKEEPPLASPEPRTEMDELLEEALAEEEETPLTPSDFDAGSKRFLTELMNRDRTQGTGRSVEALDMVFKQTRNKSRQSVNKWPAYVFTLLQKFDPDLHEELYLRDIEQRREREKNKLARGEGAPRRDDIKKAWDFVPDEGTDGTRQVLDRWGKPVLI